MDTAIAAGSGADAEGDHGRLDTPDHRTATGTGDQGCTVHGAAKEIACK